MFGKRLFLHEMASIGNYNHIGNNTMMLNSIVGNYCSIAPNVKLGQLEHDLRCVSTNTHIFGPQNGLTDFTGYKSKTVIGNDVWLAANVVVKQGVTVNTGAVIGAGAVVTKDIPPYAIAVGSPIRIIRYRMTEEQIAAMQRIQWWNWEDERLHEVEKMFEDIDGFIEKWDV